MKIIDSHLHLPVRKELLTLEDQKKELLSELSKYSIQEGIVIPDNVQDSSIGNLRQYINLFKDNPNIHILGTVNILNDNLEKKIIELEKYFKEKKIVGIKIFPGHDYHYPNDESLKPFWELCIKYKKPFVIHTGENSGDRECSKYNDPKYIVEIAKRYPDLKIVISHLFWPKVKYCVEITKEFSSISYDTSGLADEEVVLKTGKEEIKDSLEKLIKKYNKKVLYGSDYGMCSIKNHIELIYSLNISEEDRKRVFFMNTITIFDLK